MRKVPRLPTRFKKEKADISENSADIIQPVKLKTKIKEALRALVIGSHHIKTDLKQTTDPNIRA